MSLARSGIEKKHAGRIAGKGIQAKEKKVKRNRRVRSRGNDFFFFCFANIWRKRIHSVVKRLHNVHGIKWLRKMIWLPLIP